MEQSTPEALPYGTSVQVTPVIQEECTWPPAPVATGYWQQIPCEKRLQLGVQYLF